MKLSFETIKSITLGAVSITDIGGSICFGRMTKAQADAFTRESEGHAVKTAATSGIRFDFTTDATNIKLGLSGIRACSSRNMFCVDVYVNGELYIHRYSSDVSALDKECLEIVLDGKCNRVQIFLPSLAKTDIEYIEVSDGATVTPSGASRRILCYGDSITQGYDAKFTSGTYVNVLARTLDAEVFDQAIGGAIFNSEVIDVLPVKPDIITVAYGTNDWSKLDKESFEAGVAAFFDRLKEVHGGIRTFVILPIWRADWDAVKSSGGFYECRQKIAKAALSHGFEVIDDISILPHDPRFFSDLYLHPNDIGFELYGKAITKYILENE